MKYEFNRCAIEAVLRSSEDCQTLIMDIKKETELMMAELDKVKDEFLAQENRSKKDNVKTFRKGKDVFVRVEDVEDIINRILKEKGFGAHPCDRERGFGIDHAHEMPTISVCPISEEQENNFLKSLLDSL